MGTCKLDFLRSSSSELYQDEHEFGSDGSLVAEFRAMERFHRQAIAENSYSFTRHSYACSVQRNHYLACLDLAGPGTFTGDGTSPAIDWTIEATDVNYKNVSAVYLVDDLDPGATGRNLFGIDCSNAPGTTGGTRHGDGVINSYDIGVLVYTLFQDPPYDQLPASGANYYTVETVDQRPETQSRCGNNMTRADWQVELVSKNYCPPNLDYDFRRRRLSETYMLALAGATDRTITASTELTHAVDRGFVRSRFAGVNDEGSWHSFEFAPSVVPVIAELIVNNLWVEGRAQLSNAPPPRNGQEIPIAPEHFQLRWSRTREQEAFARTAPPVDPALPNELMRCKSIVSGATGTRAIIGDTISVRQEGRGVPCPFALHLWIPTVYSLVDYGRALSEAGNDTSELRFVWAKRGSTAMTTTGGVVLNPTFPYEFEAHPPPPPVPSSPPRPPLEPPPAPPAPPGAPPPLYRSLNVTQRFKLVGESSEEVVEELQAQIKNVEEAVRTFLTNVTRTAAASIDTDVAVLSHDHGDEDDSDEPHLSPNSTIVYVPNGSVVLTPSNGNNTENASNATNSSAPVDSRRRLGHDGCENGARLDVAIVFEEDVELGVIEAIKEEWPTLANFTQGVEACEEADFDPTTSDARQDPTADRSATILIVSMGIGVALLCCGACLFFIFAGRRRRQREEDYNKKNDIRKSDGAETTGLMVGEMPLLALAQPQLKETQPTLRMAKF